MRIKKIIGGFKSPVIKFCFNLISNRVERKLEKSDNQPLKKVADSVLALSAGYVKLFTDKDPDNTAQVKAFVKEHRQEHLELGMDAIRLYIEQIQDTYKKDELLMALNMIDELVVN